MKKLLAFLLAMLLFVSLCACKAEPEQNDATDPTTTAPTQPSEPSEPSEPSDPGEPTDPTGPTFDVSGGFGVPDFA